MMEPPIVEVFDPEDEFVGPPSVVLKAAQQNTPIGSTTNLQRTRIRAAPVVALPEDGHAVIYMPSHPSTLPEARPLRSTPVRRAAAASSKSNSQKNLRSRVAPTYVPDTTIFAPAAPTPSIPPTTITYSNSTRARAAPIPPPNVPRVIGPPTTAPVIFNGPNHPPMVPMVWPTPSNKPRFGSAPNFTAPFGNTLLPAHAQPPPSNNTEQLNRHPAPIVRVQNPANTQNSNLPSQNLRYLRPQLINPNQPPRGPIPNFPTQAIPVRPAFDDFVKQLNLIAPNMDAQQLINSLCQSPGQLAQLAQMSQISNLAQLLQPGNSNQPLPQQPPVIPKPPPPSEDDIVRQDLDADEDDEFEQAETYSDYVPCKLTIGQPHPDPVVEASSLATVEPPDVYYRLKLPQNVIDRGLLSALQLESVIYACQQHDQFLADNKTRRGFLIGDGAGVGKGRTIAGIIFENYLDGRKKSIWLSASTDLKFDAERDLKDLGASRIPVHLLTKFPYGKKIDADKGVVFSTYSGLVSKSQSMRGSQGSRLGQLISWAGPNFDGVIVFDECHKAKNISMNAAKKKHSKAAEFALDLQNKLPNARLVYASATGASETKHLGYMTRLGIWGPGTPYANFTEFCHTIERRGVGAMELVAVDLKMRGSYIARQLSFKTTSFRIHNAELQNTELYDQCVDMWAKALQLFTEASTHFDRKKNRSIWSAFWGAHQRFFKYLCISTKVPEVIKIARESVSNGKSVVIGLQSTGESKMNEALEDGELTDFFSTARATFESLVDNQFPVPPEARGRRRCAASSRSSESDSRGKSPASLQCSSSMPSSSTELNTEGSDSTIIDETWHGHDQVKFSVKGGLVEVDVGQKASSSGKRRVSKLDENKVFREELIEKKARITKNQKALNELKEAKKSPNKSDRALRAKRRTSKRNPTKTRIIFDADTDSDNSNSLSSLLSSSSPDNDSDSTFIGSSEDVSTDVETSDRTETRPSSAISSDSDVVITAVKRHPDIVILSSGDSDIDSNENSGDEESPFKKYGQKLIAMQDQLYALIDEIGPKLPHNTLDDLVELLGGPSQVAEMTGRKGRIVRDEDGQIGYKSRNELDSFEALNIAEKERFMNGEKIIAIISEAASSGISLQADKRVKNKRRRVHITIELPWSADRAIQQFGRTHRSNQVSGPEYVFVVSSIAGEYRFASIVAKRLESLGALTHGDRRATSESRDLSQFNLESKYCKHALELLGQYLERTTPFGGINPDYQGNFIKDAREAYVGTGLGRTYGSHGFVTDQIAYQLNFFLNRLLGMKYRVQNAIFKLFSDYLDRLIARKKVTGSFDAGILELNSQSGKTRCGEPEIFYLQTGLGTVKCALRNVLVERGISFEEALKLLESNNIDKRSGFYTSANFSKHTPLVYLMLREPDSVDLFRTYKPNTGRQPKPELFSELTRKSSTKVSPREAERFWRYIYDVTDTKCVHQCFYDSCKRIEAKYKCDVGLRHRKYCILSGGVLTAWPYIEKKAPKVTEKLQIVRLRLDSKNRVIGPIIPQDQVERVRSILRDGENGFDIGYI